MGAVALQGVAGCPSVPFSRNGTMMLCTTVRMYILSGPALILCPPLKSLSGRGGWTPGLFCHCVATCACLSACVLLATPFCPFMCYTVDSMYFKGDHVWCVLRYLAGPALATVNGPLASGAEVVHTRSTL